MVSRLLSSPLSPFTFRTLYSRSRLSPSSGDAEQLELWSQVVTGMELEANGGVPVLDAATWLERWLKLKEGRCHLLSPFEAIN